MSIENILQCDISWVMLIIRTTKCSSYLWIKCFDRVVQHLSQQVVPPHTGPRPACLRVCRFEDLKRPKPITTDKSHKHISMSYLKEIILNYFIYLHDTLCIFLLCIYLCLYSAYKFTCNNFIFTLITYCAFNCEIVYLSLLTLCLCVDLYKHADCVFTCNTLCLPVIAYFTLMTQNHSIPEECWCYPEDH